MRTGKFFAAVVMLCLCFMITEPVQAGTEEKSTELTTQIPDEHLVNLDIGKHGSVIVDGKKYTGKQEIKVRRLEAQTYQVKPDSGYQADKVLYDGKTVKLTVSGSVSVRRSLCDAFRMERKQEIEEIRSRYNRTKTVDYH